MYRDLTTFTRSSGENRRCDATQQHDQLSYYSLTIMGWYRESNASPFGGFFMIDGDGRLNGSAATTGGPPSSSVAIVCSSPEEFLRVSPLTTADDKQILSVQSKPIKGTLKRRLDTEDFDDMDAESLRTDPKSRSENLMIADLVRNDFGRVCEPGSGEETFWGLPFDRHDVLFRTNIITSLLKTFFYCVFGEVDCVEMLSEENMGQERNSKLCVVEKYATLFQLVTTVSGVVDPKNYVEKSGDSSLLSVSRPLQKTQIGIVKSTFPPGSMTGAPKIRTMDILEKFVEVSVFKPVN